MAKKTKTEIKEAARLQLMRGLANALGMYWAEDQSDASFEAEFGCTPAEFSKVMFTEADRVAKLLGYENAWAN
jgi:hypothetical protein